MADELSGTANSTAILERLTRDHYFVTARHGHEEVVYQYHPLLQEFLVKRAEEALSSQDRTALQSRAAELLEAAGQIEDTVAMRIAARDWQDLMRIVRAHAEGMVEQGRGETLEQWLEQLPPARLNSDPWMLHWLAACRLPVSPRESRRLYEQSYEMFASRKTPDRDGQFAALAGVMYAILNDLDDLTLLDRWIGEAVALAGSRRGRHGGSGVNVSIWSSPRSQ